MNKRTLICAAALGMLLAWTVTANAQTFTTDDGVISITTPDPDENTSEWIQMSDPNYWFTISDGKSTITIDHLSNGEEVPKVQIADPNYEGVFQAYVSTYDEVFVVKATTPKLEDLDSMISIVSTVKILKYGTKKAIVNETPEASEFSARAINKTYYVTADELNVRSTCSTDSNIIGTLHRGDAVTVKGMVQRNGQDYGWYQIEYNGRDAYVSAGFLSETKPTEESTKSTEKSTEKYAVSNGFTVYDINGNNQGSLVKYSDGYYYSNDGQPYKDNGNGSYYGVNTGDTLYNYNPNPNYEPAEPGSQPGSFQVWDANGNAQGYLTPHTDDSYYYSNDGQPYRDNGDGSYYGVNTGDTLYSYRPSSSKSAETGTAGSNYYDDSVTHLLEEQTTGSQVYVSASSYDSYVWTDGNGTEYQNNGDGTFTDYYGNHYDLVY